MTSLSDALKSPPAPPVVNRDPDKNFTSQLEVKGDTAEVTVRLAADTPSTPEGAARDVLTDYGLDPNLFEVTSFRSSKWTMAGGDEGVSARFSFAKKGAQTAGVLLPDLDDLHAMIARQEAVQPPPATGEKRSVLAILADPQVGKTDSRGGIEELLARLESSRQGFVEYVQRVRPEEIILFDAGDSIENFESTGSEERTNDLQLTEQIRVWRRVFWSWIDTASQLAPSVKVLSVGSNHCRVRRGKNNLGTPSDDYGIEVLTQVADMAAIYPERYGHVQFFAPGRHDETVAIQAVGGKVIGLAHGHQVGNPDMLGKWWAGQALGRTPVGGADILVVGHFHHLRVQTIGDDRWLFIAPTSDSGSSWFRNLSGNESAPGVLTMALDEGGWFALNLC